MQLNEIISVNQSVSSDVRAKLDECTFVGIDFGTSTTTVTRLVYDRDVQQVMSAPLMIAQADASGVEIESHLVPTVIATTGNGRLISGKTTIQIEKARSCQSVCPIAKDRTSGDVSPNKKRVIQADLFA